MLLRRQTYRLRRDFLNSSRVTYSTSYSPLILAKDNTRLEMELKAMLDELYHQKDCNKLLCDEVTGLKMNIEHYKGWEKRSVKSDWKRDENMVGEWNYTSGKWNGDANDKGIQTTEDYRFYAISAEFSEFSNKDNNLVFQFNVKHEQKLDCGGGYMC